MLKGWTTSVSLGSYSTRSFARANAVEEAQVSDSKDTVKRNLKKLDIDRSSWQRKAKNRAAWKKLVRPKYKVMPKEQN